VKDWPQMPEVTIVLPSGDTVASIRPSACGSPSAPDSADVHDLGGEK